MFSNKEGTPKLSLQKNQFNLNVQVLVGNNALISTLLPLKILSMSKAIAVASGKPLIWICSTDYFSFCGTLSTVSESSEAAARGSQPLDQLWAMPVPQISR